VWDFEITQGWALGALALMTIPSVMIALSVLLPTKANQLTNIVVASLFMLVSIGNAIGETWAFIWLGAIVEVALLATMVRITWRWRSRSPPSDNDAGAAALWCGRYPPTLTASLTCSEPPRETNGWLRTSPTASSRLPT
jgi:hypothetical protein